MGEESSLETGLQSCTDLEKQSWNLPPEVQTGVFQGV